MLRESSEPLSPGALLRDRFELQEVVGRGGTSVVYRALDRIRASAPPDRCEVAVKVTNIRDERDADLAELVHRERHFLRDIIHSNVVRVYDSDCDGEHHYLVMELLRGRPLTKIISALPGGGRLPIERVVQIVEQAAAGLAHVHRCGIVHGDIKAGNLFITAAGVVKIIDFGAARRLTASTDGLSQPGSEAAGALTPIYASPQMIAGESAAESDDVFSLAAVIYVLLAGRHPFRGHDAGQAQDLGLRLERPNGLSAARWRVLQRGLALERERRIAHIEEFADQFIRPPLTDRLSAFAFSTGGARPLFWPRPKSA